MRRLLFALSLAAAAGCSKSASLPVINAFSATPDTIHLGQSSTLAWDVTGASALSIDNGVGVQTGHSVTVTPAVTTTYKLTATGLGGDTPATVTVTVLPALPKPVISDFHASPNDVAAGRTTRLSWTVTGATSLSIDHGVGDVTGRTAFDVTVSADTLFTLTATNDGGPVTKTAAVSTHPPGLQLNYTNPTAAGTLLLVKNADLSTSNEIVLDVKVGATDVTAFGFAINIPLDANGATMVALPTSLGSGSSLTVAGLETSGLINVGGSPVTATALLGGSAMPGVLSVGAAKNKAAAGSSGDDTWPANARLFSIVLRLNSGAVADNTIFSSTTVAADPKFRAAAIAHDGSTVVGTKDVAIGDLIISN